jgi:hypothetical protein
VDDGYPHGAPDFHMTSVPDRVLIENGDNAIIADIELEDRS